MSEWSARYCFRGGAIWLGVVALSCLGVVACDRFTEERKFYETDRADLAGGLLQARPMEEAERNELALIRQSWERVESEVPADQIENEALSQAGLPKTISGLVALYTEPAAPFDPTDPAANAQNLALMRVQRQMGPVSTDGAMYFDRATAFIHLNGKTTMVYQEDAGGVSAWAYRRPDRLPSATK